MLSQLSYEDATRTETSFGDVVEVSHYVTSQLESLTFGQTAEDMALKLGKLDAICAKLKSFTKDDSDFPTNGEPFSELDDLSESNNNNQKTIDFNESFDVVKSAPPSPPSEIPKRFDVITSEASSTYCQAPTPKSHKSSGRKKSRKSSCPRNLAHYEEVPALSSLEDGKDDLTPFILRNQNHEFQDGDDGDFDDLHQSVSVDSSRATSPGDGESFSHHDSSVSDQEEYLEKSENDSRSFASSGFPLDLSMNRAADEVSLGESPLSDMDKDPLCQSSGSHDRVEGHVIPPAHHPKSASAPEDKVLQDYAKNTMNELLSIYGFGSADSIPKHASLKQFPPYQSHVEKIHAHLDSDSPSSLVQQPAVVNGKSPNAAKNAYTKLLFQKSQHMNGGPSHGSTLSPTGSPSVTPGKKVAAPLALVPSAHSALKVASSSTSKGNVGGEFSKFRLVPSGHKLSHSLSPSGKTFNQDYNKYLKRFHNGEDCGGTHCKDLGYREHYHCLDCSFKVFVKKEEMVRHFKWHKKRDDSLQHGFLRFSPMDDCSHKFGACTHNGRQTHYHCLQQGCDKVYISTSDVQMHANYHRKDSAIIMEGFQRFRATEDCGTPLTCQFYGQRTTHFHCRRTSCKFTFKNKADMEKHKTYHQKDEILGRDGFKKFMKYEHCSYKNCRFSKISNHIHCIRPGCTYVLHSTAQLYSHKRKHERRDFEHAYRNFRQIQKSPNQPSPQVLKPLQGMIPVSVTEQHLAASPLNLGLKVSPSVVPSMSLPVKIKTEQGSFKPVMPGMTSPGLTDLKIKVKEEPKEIERSPKPAESQRSRILEHASELSEEKLNDSLTLPIPSAISPQKEKHAGEGSSSSSSPPQNLEAWRHSPEKRERDESWKTYLIRYTANDPCNSRCQFLYKDHYHCRVEGCQVLFRSKDGVREHAKFHEIQDRITPLVYIKYDESQACPQKCHYNLKQKHYHCNWTGCSHAVPHTGPAFARLEHYRIHEYAKASGGKGKLGSSKDDEFTKRRRGRPPKYPKTEIPCVPKVELPEDVIAESVRLYSEGKFDPTAEVVNGFKHFPADEECPDTQCMHYMKDHFHCARPRCHHATDRMDVLNLHAKDFHNFVNILEGFEFFDRNIDCRRPHCHNNRANRHFHCLKPKCDYSFVRHSTMVQHDRKHRMPAVPKIAPVPNNPVKKELASNFIPIVPAMPGLHIDAKNKTIIKAAGTFYPMSPLADIQGSIASTVFNQSLSLAMTSQAMPIVAQPLASTVTALPTNMSSLIPIMNAGQFPFPMASTLPLTVLLQQKQNIPTLDWSDIEKKMHFDVDQNCNRPFCKLKKKDHYHCLECNQAFSDPARLRYHVVKHGLSFQQSGIKDGIHSQILPQTSVGLDLSSSAEPLDGGEEEEEEEEDDMSEKSGPAEGDYEVSASSSLNLNPEAFADMIRNRKTLDGYPDEEEEEEEEGDIEEEMAEEYSTEINQSLHKFNGNHNSRDGTISEPSNYDDDSFSDRPLIVDESQGSPEANAEDEIGLNLSLSRRSGRKRTAAKHEDFIDSDIAMNKQRRLSNPKDQLAVPEGFARYRPGEDCGYKHCTYHSNGTHYHCTREDCGYGFSDRTRFIQHVMRHERLDNIMGGEFCYFRSGMSCERQDCDLSLKSSHFHCLKCPFTCADSSKVTAHRKYHVKMDSIASNGFQKFTGSEDCKNMMCSYYKKQTHYHCTFPTCNHAVLGPAQMAAHKVKHPQEELN